MSKIAEIQTILGVKPDGEWGPKSQAALAAQIQPAGSTTAEPATRAVVHAVRASSFADPVDVASFRRCKVRGGSDQECFKVGDNGVGKWGDDTTANRPMCALPPEDWQPFGEAARGRKVLVRANGKEVVCELRDTMPRRANITNGAGIDLNPAACAALGAKPPMLIAATWQWACLVAILSLFAFSGCADLKEYNSHVAAREDSLSGYTKDGGGGVAFRHRVEYR